MDLRRLREATAAAALFPEKPVPYGERNDPWNPKALWIAILAQHEGVVC